MAPFNTNMASTSCRQDMAKNHRQPEALLETFGETITKGEVVSL